MSLHVKRHEYAGTGGSGIPLLLIHGWGMHGGLWDGVAEVLAQYFSVLVVDLPGHGHSTTLSPANGRGAGPDSLDAIVDALSEQFDEPLAVCGWSMGGQIALRWALRHPLQVERLVLVSSTPCFAERHDWQFGMPGDTLYQFAADLEQDHAATLRRFLGLQVRGSEGERELLVVLRERLASCGEPDPDALRVGLEILRDLDLRDELPEIKQPVLVIAGERDRLSLPQASRFLAQAIPNARLVEIGGAAHAPFLSHQEKFVAELINFMENKSY